MDMTSLILMQLGTIAVTVAVTRTRVGGMATRINRLERRMDEMPKAYVPRTEVELALKGIEGHAKLTSSLIQAMIYGGDRRQHLSGIEAAAAPLDFVQIVIEGLDGRSGLNRWEGRIPYLYLDARTRDGVPAPLVTVGIGCALDLPEALTLPFQIDGRPASQLEIARDFSAVQAASPGWAATAYAKFTACRLTDAAMEDLVRRRFAIFLPALRRLFPGFDSFPATAKAGCLDLIYGLGVAGLSPPHYPAFHQAVLDRNWATAAAECGSDTAIHAYALRNQARAQLFLKACG